MGIADRLRRVARAWRGSDDPADLAGRLDDTYREQIVLLQQVSRGVADLATHRKRVELQLTKLRHQAEQLDEQAKVRVAAGDDDGARAALTRRAALVTAADELGDRHADLVSDEARLQATAADLQAKVDAFRLRKDTLVARRSAATARSEITRATTGISSSSSDVGQAMAEAERHTRELDARSDAVDELVAEGIMDGPGGPAPTGHAESERWDRAFEAADPHRAPGEDRSEGGSGGQNQIQG
ncbi:PspA/IM30 family protein [Aeromicrobium marinum DSM 15272]|uniref:PspA/IM30 family protein n=1 Tax=Aeromicrobium marinum DSM 15272 TaxID=585531 RepID=E2SAP3_9ACTN|nr:PspA/IM30 family protein [Aeromicrobium marinum]EFQ83439.1 PspA/IM30 family protein [Aeromicrobium marinum DSM 15272]